MKVLTHTLLDEVNKIILLDESLAKELNYKLKFFNSYSEFQLLNLLNSRQNHLNRLSVFYKEDLWLMILQVANQLGVTDERLKDLIVSSQNLPENNESVKDYNLVLDNLFIEKKDQIGGLDYQSFKSVANDSMTAKELREYAKSVGINLPSSILRNEILTEITNAAISKYPKQKEQLREELAKKTVIQLKRYAIDEKLDVSYDLRKESIIDMFIEAYSDFKFKSVVKEIDFNLPPRILENTHLREVVKEVTEVPSKEVYSKEAYSQEARDERPIHINIYYDGVKQSESSKHIIKTSNPSIINQVYKTNDQDNKQVVKEESTLDNIKDEEDIKKLPLWLVIIIGIGIFILVLILLIIFLDIIGLIPYNSNPISQFIYKILLGKD